MAIQVNWIPAQSAGHKIFLGCHEYSKTNAFGFSFVEYSRNDKGYIKGELDEKIFTIVFKIVCIYNLSIQRILPYGARGYGNDNLVC